MLVYVKYIPPTWHSHHTHTPTHTHIYICISMHDIGSEVRHIKPPNLEKSIGGPREVKAAMTRVPKQPLGFPQIIW